MKYEIISIHAPMKGATDKAHNITGFLDNISIHAPMKGATIKLSSM